MESAQRAVWSTQRLRFLAVLAAMAITMSVATACAGSTVPPVSNAPAKRLVYVALGASDAVGVGAGGAAQSWVADLFQHLPRGSRLIDLGVSGSTLHDALTQQLPVAVDAQPDLVTVWLAVNDFDAKVPLPTYQRDLTTVLDTLHTRTHAHVLVANVPDLTQLPLFAQTDHQQLATQIAAWNTTIAQDVAAHGDVLVDLHSTWRELSSHPEYIGADGFHPSAEGYQQLASLFLASVPKDLLT
jgi:lysophospholipase L1-like esterase